MSRSAVIRAQLEQAAEAVRTLRTLNVWTATPIALEGGDADLGYRAESELAMLESLGGERKTLHIETADGRVRVVSTVTLTIDKVRFVATSDEVLSRPEFERRMRAA